MFDAAATIFDPAFMLAAVPAILSVGLSKGGLTSIGGLAVPLLAFVVPPTVASGIVLPLLCFSDLIAMWTFRRHLDVRLLLPLVAAAAIGVVLGFLSFRLMSESTIGLMIGLVTVLFTVRHWLSGLVRRLAPPGKPGRLAGLIWSCLSGFTSFIAHAGGPPLMFYLLPLKLDRVVFTSVSVFFFGVINYVKLPFFGALGLLNTDNLMISLALAPVALVGLAIGTWMLKVMDEALFYRLSYILTFLAGLKLIWDGLAG
jgi:uncharacterized membrane protein YfcA